MRMRHILMTGGLAIAAWLALFGDKTPDNDLAVPVKNPSASAVRTDSIPIRANLPIDTTANAAQEPPVLKLQSRDTLIGGMRRAEKSSGLFASYSWTPSSPPPVAPVATAPTAPPLPFKYLGKQKVEDQWQVFLTRDTTTFIIKKNDVIENQYRVQDIKPPSMTLLYLPLNQPQSLTIE